MKLVSNDLKEVTSSLKMLRDSSYMDIYKENEFSSVGYLLDKDYILYKYTDSLKFNNSTHSFRHFVELFKYSSKIDYNIFKKYLLDELKITEKEYKDNRSDETKTIETIKIESNEYEFNNSILFDKVEKKLLELSEGEK